MKVLLTWMAASIAVCCVVAQECSLPSNSAECPNQQTGTSCCTWNTAYNNMSIYDRSLAYDSDTKCRPLGYGFATWYYQKLPNIPQPCVTLQCASQTNCRDWVLISVETSPPSSLCVLNNQGGAASCGQGSFSFCAKMASTSVQYSFECQTGCGESNVDYWYRFITITPQPGEDGNDLCNDITVEYPSSLAQLPDNRNPANFNPNLPVPTPSSAALALPSLLLCLAGLLSLLV